MKCYGLSLSDHYWMKPNNLEISWKDVNFFTNDFSMDFGDLVFKNELSHTEDIDLMSPDNTSDGVLQKKWIISNEKRYLVKGGSGLYNQQPYNEIIACFIMERLKINHVAYSLYQEKDKVFSICENFLDIHTELIPANRIYNVKAKKNHDSKYSHLLDCVNELGIDNILDSINKMIVIDYIIANTDRHFNNFGFIRDADTLEWIGFSPIYDSGTSLWNESLTAIQNPTTKTFAKTHEEQVKLVTDFSWYDRDALKDIPQECYNILIKSEMNKERVEMISEALHQRIERISEIATNSKKPQNIY